MINSHQVPNVQSLQTHTLDYQTFQNRDVLVHILRHPQGIEIQSYYCLEFSQFLFLMRVDRNVPT